MKLSASTLRLKDACKVNRANSEEHKAGGLNPPFCFPVVLNTKQIQTGKQERGGSYNQVQKQEGKTKRGCAQREYQRANYGTGSPFD